VLGLCACVRARARVCVRVRCTQRGAAASLQGLAILCVVPALVLQFALRPYWDKRVDALDCICCLSILLQLEATIYFNNAEVCACLWCPCARACARACVRACVRARAGVWVCVRVRACVR
jgi:hypothetical protein